MEAEGKDMVKRMKIMEGEEGSQQPQLVLTEKEERLKINPGMMNLTPTRRKTKRMSFSLIIHHGGHFEVGENTGYNGGDLAVANINDVDRWSFFEAVGLVRDLGYKEDFLLWWNSDSAEYEGGYKSLKVDNDAVKCAEFALLHNCDIQLYVESLVGETIDGESSGKGVQKEGEGNVESDPEHGVHFDDSEEERALGLDDGFEDELTVKPPKGRRKVCSTHKASSPAKRAAMGMILDSSSDEDPDYEMEDDYESEELYSSATESEEDNTGLKKMRYPVFKKEEFNKDYKFMIGLEFRSIGEFKEVMLEYAVLNGASVPAVSEPTRASVPAVSEPTCASVPAVSEPTGVNETQESKTKSPVVKEKVTKYVPVKYKLRKRKTV